MNERMRAVSANARWLASAAWQTLRARPPREGPDGLHVLIAIADHFEPCAGGVDARQAEARVAHWVETYPRSLGSFTDSDGRPPRHTFFYPIEEYDPDHLDQLATLARAGFGEVEIHLHHDGDTPESLHRTLAQAVENLAGRHGLLGRHRETGRPGYAFVHGNWALNNARPDGCWCGVNDEIRVLLETGCYADLTFPSAPSPTQPPTLNRIYLARSHASRARGHDHGLPLVSIGDAGPPKDALMLIQGPLLLNTRSRKRGLIPRLENACLQTSQPPTIERLDLWLKAHVHVESRPDWCFVKLHAHGAPERDRETLLGAPMQAFHRALAQREAESAGRFHYHYVTAREMANLAFAAAMGWTGTVNEARDLIYASELAAVGAGAVGGSCREPVRLPDQDGGFSP